MRNLFKHFGFLAAFVVALLLSTSSLFAQSDVTNGAKQQIYCSGSFMFPSASGTASIAADTIMRSRNRLKLPYYTAFDTVNYNSADTFKFNIGGAGTLFQLPNFNCQNLKFAFFVDSIAGGADSITIVLQASVIARPGTSTQWSTIQSFTETAATKSFWYNFTNTGGWSRYRAYVVVADRGVLAKIRWYGQVYFD